MGSVQLSGSGLVASLPPNHSFSHKTKLNKPNSYFFRSKHNAARTKTVRAISTAPASQPPAADEPDEPPAVDFAFVHVRDLYSWQIIYTLIISYIGNKDE